MRLLLWRMKRSLDLQTIPVDQLPRLIVVATLDRPLLDHEADRLPDGWMRLPHPTQIIGFEIEGTADDVERLLAVALRTAAPANPPGWVEISHRSEAF